MAEWKSNAKDASKTEYALKSRGLKNPRPMDLSPDSGSGAAKKAFAGNDKPGKGSKKSK